MFRSAEWGYLASTESPELRTVGTVRGRNFGQCIYCQCDDPPLTPRANDLSFAFLYPESLLYFYPENTDRK